MRLGYLNRSGVISVEWSPLEKGDPGTTSGIDIVRDTFFGDLHLFGNVLALCIPSSAIAVGGPELRAFRGLRGNGEFFPPW
jgi:hypothetical protein